MNSRLRRLLVSVPLLKKTYRRITELSGRQLLGMTTPAEQRYLEDYARDDYKGSGHIVDLGCWLGSTTIPLAKGLRANAGNILQKKILAYDLFIWSDWMNETVEGTSLDGRFSEGDSFVNEFRMRISGYEDVVDIREGDLTTAGWTEGLIEFLLVDAMKNLELTNAIARNFFPALAPGEGLLFHQDFAHFHTPWIHILQWRLRDKFAFEAEVPNSNTVVFRCKKTTAADDIPTLEFGNVTEDDLDAAFDHSFSLASKDKHPNIAAAKVMWYVHQQDEARAGRELERIARQNIPMKDDLVLVSSIISKRP